MIEYEGKTVITLGLFNMGDVELTGSANDRIIPQNYFTGAPRMNIYSYNSIYFNLLSSIRSFNRDNGDYYIETVEYGMCGDENAMLRLNGDITSGNVPDILMLYGMPYEEYAEKGLLEDLNSYFLPDGDKTGLGRDDLFAGPLEAMEYKDGLYWISPYNIILSWYGLTEKLGESPITIKNLFEIWQLRENSGMLISGSSLERKGVTGSGLFKIFLISQRGKYIDFVKGTCRFDTYEFFELLQLCALVGESDQRTPLLNEQYSFDAQLIGGEETLIQAMAVTTILPYKGDMLWLGRSNKSFEDISFIGVPGSEPIQALCMPQLPLAISSTSENKPGAWEFISYLIEDKGTDFIEGDTLRLDMHRNFSRPFPISKDVFINDMLSDKNYFQIWSDIEKYGDEEMSRLEEYMTIWPNTPKEEKIPYPPFMRANYEQILNIIDSATLCYYENDPITGLIMEEAQAFFGGNATADEAIDRIQARVSLYLAEHY